MPAATSKARPQPVIIRLSKISGMSCWRALNIKLQQNFVHDSATIITMRPRQDFGVDIMKPWMGNVDVVPTPNANTARSMFLGDQIKGPFTANVGFVTSWRSSSRLVVRRLKL